MALAAEEFPTTTERGAVRRMRTRPTRRRRPERLDQRDGMTTPSETALGSIGMLAGAR